MVSNKSPTVVQQSALSQLFNTFVANNLVKKEGYYWEVGVLTSGECLKALQDKEKVKYKRQKN